MSVFFEVAGCLLIIYEFMYGGVVATESAVAVMTGLHLAEVHCLGIESEQLVGEQFAYTGDVLQRLSRLYGAKHTRYCPQNSSL